jgi:hypothetical protein
MPIDTKSKSEQPWGRSQQVLVLFSLVACYLYVNNTSSEKKYDFHHTAGHSKKHQVRRNMISTTLLDILKYTY